MTQDREPYRMPKEIAQLRAQLTTMAEDQNAMTAHISELEAQLAKQVVISQKLWAELTPEKRHELNLQFKDEVKP